LWEAELANVVWMAIRQGVMTPEEGPKRLALAARLGIHSVPSRTLRQGALVRAVSSGVAVYDTLFVELAVRQELPLTTFDRKVLKMFPAVASRPGDLIPQ
jgi:predicted nucleic acid-binding protein